MIVHPNNSRDMKWTPKMSITGLFFYDKYASIKLFDCPWVHNITTTCHGSQNSYKHLEYTNICLMENINLNGQVRIAKLGVSTNESPKSTQQWNKGTYLDQNSQSTILEAPNPSEKTLNYLNTYKDWMQWPLLGEGSHIFLISCFHHGFVHLLHIFLCANWILLMNIS